MVQTNTQKRILDSPDIPDSPHLYEILSLLTDRYPHIRTVPLGHSMLGQPLSLMELGRGRPGVLYFGGQEAGDRMTPAVLTRFLNEYCELYTRRSRVFGVNLSYLAELRRIELLPMLNPDGIGYTLHGVSEEHILRERLLTMNGGSGDFSHWQGNARGVRIDRNYRTADFAVRIHRENCGPSPESEPESSTMTRLLRCREGTGLVIELRPGPKEICMAKSADGRMAGLGRILARLSGMPLSVTDGGCFCDWAAEELSIPAFTVYCGESDEVFTLYAGIREMLFVAPTLIG